MKQYIELSRQEWNNRVVNLAYNWLAITKCQKCGSPVNDGHICIFCGDSDPSQPAEENSEGKEGTK